MNSKNHLPLKGVYSWEKWTKPNPSIGTENRPADISSEENLFFQQSQLSLFKNSAVLLVLETLEF